MLEGLGLVFDLDSVDFVAFPANVTTRGTTGENSTKNEDRLKRFIFSMYPDMKVSNRYENQAIARERTTGYSQRQRRGIPHVTAVPVDG